MQLGMIGLGRMGANMTRRLTRGGHGVTVFDLSAERVRDLAAEGADGAASLDDLVRALPPPRAVWLMVPAGQPTEQMVAELATRLEAGDTIIDGGQYLLQRRRPSRPHDRATRPSLRGRRHERRALGPRPRLQPDDRRSARVGRAAGSDLCHAGARRRRHAAPRRDASAAAARPRAVTSTAARPARGIS